MKYSIQDVANAIGTSAETIRAGLILGQFPFGAAFKKEGNSAYTYVLYPKKCEEYLGLGDSGHECRYRVEDGLMIDEGEGK